MGDLRIFKQTGLALILVLALLFSSAGMARAEDGAPPEEPTATEEAAPTEEAATEEAVTEEATEAAETETAATEEATATEEPVNQEPESLADIVATLDENDAVLVGEDGEPLSLAEASTEEALAVADPWFIDPLDATQVIAYQSDCTGWVVPAGFAGGVCHVSATPVQDAINAAPAGATVNLEAGTFVEQVVINKDLTLQGAGAGTSIIQAPNSLAVNFNNGNDNRGVIYVNNADVTIDGLTVDGDGNGNGNYRFMGIIYHNASGTISNSEVLNITDTPFSGTQHGLAIYILNADGTARTVVVEDNVVANYQKNGITATGANLTVEITGNEVTGAGPTGTIAQNGIQISGGAGGTVSDNTVTDNWYTGAGWASTGLLINGSGTVDVDGNTLGDNQINGYVYGGDANFTNNDIYGGQYGLALFGPSSGATSGTVIGNDIHDNDLAVYVDNPDIPFNNNNFNNNTDGLYFSDDWSTGGTLDGSNNFWGCAEGPNEPGCDTVYGDVTTDPFAPEAFVDPEPVGGNGGGAADDDDDDFSLPQTGAPTFFGWLPLSETSLTPFVLWNGGMALFPPMANGMARINVWMDDLPLDLPAGTTYHTSLLTELMRDGVQVFNSGDSLYSVAFLLPDDVNPEDAAILYFDTVSGEWVEVFSYLTEDGFIVADRNLMGLYILVTK